MGHDSQASWIPSPNFYPGRNGQAVKWLVLHGTASAPGATAKSVAQNWFALSSSQVSAHYLVGQDGLIVSTVDENDSAWANGILEAGHDAWWSASINPNFQTISIEFVKPDVNNNSALTSAQQTAGFQLISRICQRWNIPMRAADASGGICGHNSLEPDSRAHCPGTFDWSALWSFLDNGTETMIDLTTPGVSTYFSGSDNNRWTCKKTNKTISYGILTFYRGFGGSGLCGITHLGMPVSPEIYPTSGTAIQLFERALVVYDPNKKLDNPPGAGQCYLMHIDSGDGQKIIAQPLSNTLQVQLTATQNQNAALQTQLQQLQQQLQQQTDSSAMQAAIKQAVLVLNPFS